MLASALPRRAASRAAAVTASRRAAAIVESTSEEVSTADSMQGVRGQRAGVRLGGPRWTRKLGGQRCGGDNAQESVGHVGVDLQRRDPCCYV